MNFLSLFDTFVERIVCLLLLFGAICVANAQEGSFYAGYYSQYPLYSHSIYPNRPVPYESWFQMPIPAFLWSRTVDWNNLRDYDPTGALLTMGLRKVTEAQVAYKYHLVQNQPAITSTVWNSQFWPSFSVGALSRK